LADTGSASRKLISTTLHRLLHGHGFIWVERVPFSNRECYRLEAIREEIAG
jgi:hypothetical protein